MAGGRKRHRLGEFFFEGRRRAALVVLALLGSLPRVTAERTVRITPVHLRMPSVDRGVASFVWAVVFFLFLYFGMLAIAVAKSTAILLSLTAAFVIFVVVRTCGADDPAGPS